MSKYNLDEIDFFRELSSQNLEAIEATAKEFYFSSGEPIFTEKSRGVSLYIILSGKVKIFTHNFLGEETVLTHYHAGEYFGELALFRKDSVRSASAVAITNTRLLEIHKDTLLKHLKENPKLSLELMGSLAEKITVMNRKFAGAKKDEKGQTIITAKSGKIFSFSGTRDHLGKTTNAAIAAEVLASNKGSTVLLMDLDCVYDDLNMIYGKMSKTTLVELLRANKWADVKQLDKNQVDIWRFFQRITSNLYFLPGPDRLGEGENITAFDIQGLMAILKTTFDYIIVDLGCNLDTVQHELLIMSDKVVFHVSQNDLVEIKNSVKICRVLESMGLPKENVYILGAFQGDFQGALSVKYPYPVYGRVPTVKVTGRVQNETFHANSNFKPLFLFWSEFIETYLQIKSNLKELETTGGKGFVNYLSNVFNTPTAVDNGEGPRNYFFASGPKLATEPVVKLDTYLRGLYTEIYDLMANAKFEDAYRGTHEISKIAGADVHFFRALIDYYWWTDDSAKEQAVLGKVMDLKIEDPFLKARYLHYLGDQKEYVTTLAECIKKSMEHPRSCFNHFNLGHLYRITGDARASEEFLKALELEPTFTLARVLLIRGLFEKENFTECFKHLKQLHPKNPFYLNYMSLYMYHCRKMKKANDLLRELKQSPQGPFFKIDNFQLQLESYIEKVDYIIDRYLLLVESNPTLIDTRLELMALLLEKEDFAQFERVRKELSSDLNPYQKEFLGRIFEKEKSLKEHV